MKETYPLPRPKGKRKKPALQQGAEVPVDAHPNAVLHTDQDRWHEAIFRHAAYFTVVKKDRPPGTPNLKSVRYWRKEFNNFLEALAEAHGKTQVLVYAITAEGRSFCVGPKEWDKYRKIWEETHQ